MKFLVDMPLSPHLAAWLRDRGHDAVTTGTLCGSHHQGTGNRLADVVFGIAMCGMKSMPVKLDFTGRPMPR